MTPYEITFGRKPFNFSEYLAGSSKLNVVDEMLTDREGIFQTIRKELLKAQEKMKTIADAKRREVEYHPGDWVMLKLRSYRQASAKGPQAFMGKLAKRFYGPFQVLERIGAMAYCLQLPEGTHIHPVFHCLMLKPFKGSPKSVHNIQLPTHFVQNQPVITPLAILNYRRTKDQGPWEVLVQCQGLPPDDTS